MINNNSEYIKLFEYVIKCNYSRIEIAKRLGISTNTVTKIIKEESTPSCRIMKKLCSEFNVPIKLIADFFYNIKVSDVDEFLIKRKEFIEAINISEILKDLKKQGITYTKISKRIGLSNCLISKYVKDDTAASCEIFRKLVKEFHIRPVFIKEEYQIDIYNDPLKEKSNRRIRIMDDMQAKYEYKEYTKIKK